MLQQLCQEYKPEAFANAKLVLSVWVGRRILVYSVMVRLACGFCICGTAERSVFKFGSSFVFGKAVYMIDNESVQ